MKSSYMEGWNFGCWYFGFITGVATTFGFLWCFGVIK